MDVSTIHLYLLWDSIMLAAAAQAQCRVLLSEDLHPGCVWRGVEVRKPL